MLTQPIEVEYQLTIEDVISVSRVFYGSILLRYPPPNQKPSKTHLWGLSPMTGYNGFFAEVFLGEILRPENL
jgi:hypothetical protein